MCSQYPLVVESLEVFEDLFLQKRFFLHSELWLQAFFGDDQQTRARDFLKQLYLSCNDDVEIIKFVAYNWKRLLNVILDEEFFSVRALNLEWTTLLKSKKIDSTYVRALKRETLNVLLSGLRRTWSGTTDT